jgi:ribonucleoside-diphosphate reductase alpha chain
MQPITQSPTKISGLKIDRLFTKPENNLLDQIQYEKRISEITNEKGETVSKYENIEVPSTWSQVATDILAKLYLRKKGIPQSRLDHYSKFDYDFKTFEEEFGFSSEQINEDEKTSENSIKQVAHRLAGTWTYWGQKHGYFATPEDTRAFYDELKYLIISQTAAPNSPQWFNTGLNWAYGIKGNPQGHFFVDPVTGKTEKSPDAYTHPQPHACFIQGLRDDLVNEGGIFDLLIREARVFKYGSGSGTNFSALRGRGEPLAGGGTSSGLMSFLSVFDKSAGSIKSGGTTRRAAKMVTVDIDHPEIENFINWKAKEERKVASLVAGSKNNYELLKQIIDTKTQSNELAFRESIAIAKKYNVPLNYIKRILMMTDNGLTSENFTYEVYDTDFRSESYTTVDGQNSNNSIRITDEFIKAVQDDEAWNLKWRTDGKICKTLKARNLWDQIALAAWESADPGLQFDTTINDWHTCPQGGRINASNPCSEYMFLDNTACNLASINLGKFYDAEKRFFDTKAFEHTARLLTIVLEISVTMSQHVGEELALKTYQYRTLGLGYANLGAILMKAGLPYDSKESCNIAATITAILTGTSYATSAEIASVLGAFEKFDENRQDMMRVIRNHRRATYDTESKNTTNQVIGDYESVNINPAEIDSKYVPEYMLAAARKSWDLALTLGEKYGYRNAQTTAIAPTGTIGLVMDCDTTGIEPDFALIKYKKLVGGGYMKLVNSSVAAALKNLGYGETQQLEISEYIEKYSKIEGAPGLAAEHLAVFDTASKNGTDGERFINAMGHVRMLASTQPFVSGSISKTINLPEHATLQDVKDIYMESWKLGLKCNAIYRDSSKLSQPLSSGSKDDKYTQLLNEISADEYTKYNSKDEINEISKVEKELAELRREVAYYRKNAIESKNMVARKRLPSERNSITHKFSVAGHEGYIIVGMYENGQPGEIFIQMNKEGSTLSGIMDAWAITLSLGLQYGVPIESLIKKFVRVKFDPAGLTSNPDIPIARSIVDYIGRWLSVKFLPIEQAKLYHNEDLVEKIFAEKEVKASQMEFNLGHIEGHTEHSIDDNLNLTIEDSVLEGNLMDKAEIVRKMKEQNEDSPICSDCGAVMVRNGSCYKCIDCGATSGCS